MCERGPFRSPRHDLGSVGAQRGERARGESPPRQLGAAKFKGESPEPQAKSSSQRHVVGRGERLSLKSVAK